MPGERMERRLTAILAADVAGYSRLTGTDEEGTHLQFKEHLQSPIDPKITEHRGRIVKNTGDGLLAEFSSVVDAVRCAVDIQRGMAERNTEAAPDKRIEFRIGVNVGDIIIDEGDIFRRRCERRGASGSDCGARWHPRVGPSSGVRAGPADVVFEDAGEQQLKNIVQPIRVYRVRLDHTAKQARPNLVLPNKASIAVLPFENLSGDPEQEYFTDGMVEEIITALSRFNIFVIARNSSFTYKGRAVDMKQVGRELGVRYVLEGSVRKAGNRVRISGQLIDASTGAHLWADRFDGALEDIFDVQEQVTASVVGAIGSKMGQAEIDRARRKPTDSLDAYDYFLRGLSHFHRWTYQANNEAMRLYDRAIELDPGFALAYGMAAYCYVVRKGLRWATDRVTEAAEAARLARKTIELAWDDGLALSLGGRALAFAVGDLDDGVAIIDKALVLNPNLALAWEFSGWTRVSLGEPEMAIQHYARAMRLSPLDPYLYTTESGTALAHFHAGRYELASDWAKKALRGNPYFPIAMNVLAASLALAGRMEEAQKATARVRRSSRASHFQSQGYSYLSSTGRYGKPRGGLRQAGLPE
jgi:TolB-like protein